MSDSCTDGVWATSSSISPLATVAITAALSAAAGSAVTLLITRRRRQRRCSSRGDDSISGQEVTQDSHCPPQPQQLQHPTEHPQSPSPADTNVDSCDNQSIPLLEFSRSPPGHADSNGDSGDDQVSSLGEVSRGISQRHYNPKRSSTTSETGDMGDGPASDHTCTCKLCMTCEKNKKPGAEFHPASLLPMRRKGRRGSLPNMHLPRCSSTDSIKSLRDSMTSVGSDDGLSEFLLSRRLSQRSSTMSTINSSLILEEESYISETELKFKGVEDFDEILTNVAKDLPDSLNLLRRTRAISALSNRLMAAPDEATCIEEVTRLLVLMFGVERVSFAMLTGSDHFLLKRVDVKRKGAIASSSFDLEYLDSDYRRPLAGTAAGECARTLKESYTSSTKDSKFATHKVFYRNGVNTILISPILVNGNKCAGCIMITRKEEDGYKKGDRVLISDIGMLLGANIYAKRLLRAAEESKKRAREMLHSFIPPKVLEKIECYWDANSEEYKSRKSNSLSSPDNSIIAGSVGSSSQTSSGHQDNQRTRSNSWYVAQTEWTDDETKNEKMLNKKAGVKEKIQMIRNMNRLDDSDKLDVGVIVSTQEMDFAPTSRALYAESVKNVCIVFTDIVGFSRISMDISPSEIMDMLQNLFNRFDELCDLHEVLKLETIGDAYICATNLMEDDDDGVQDAAVRALAMAKDMVMEAINVRIPKSQSGTESPFETLEIRVGIHVGDIMCGVLGQRLPKFTTCGSAVNMAARMEQTSQPSRIRVSKDFHDLVGDAESGWMEKEIIPIKNMGEVESYLLDPILHLDQGRI